MGKTVYQDCHQNSRNNSKDNKWFCFWMCDKHQTYGNPQNNHSSTQVIRKHICKQCLNAAHSQKYHSSFQGFHSLSHFDDQIGQCDDHCNLCNLCRLKLYPKLQPSSRSMRGDSQGSLYQHHENSGYYIDHKRKFRQNMIIKIGHYNCQHKTADTVHCLFFEIEHIVPFINLSHVRACTVKHDQTKAHDQYDYCDQIKIIVI